MGSMTKLECNVTICLHNADHCCCKQSIMVDGYDAKEKEQTCCGSFDENKGGLFKNVFKTPESSLSVDCEAVQCIYNDNRHCAAAEDWHCRGRGKQGGTDPLHHLQMSNRKKI